jgi:hypothetical protein
MYFPFGGIGFRMHWGLSGKRFSVDTAQGKVKITAQTVECRRPGAAASVSYDFEYTARNTIYPIPENQHA